MCIFYPCTKILRTQKFAKQALFTTAKEIIHDINSPLIRYHTDIEYITTFLRHTCVSSSDRHDIFNFSYEPHENVAVIHFLQKITHFAHILQLDRQLYAPKTLHETPLRSFCPNFRSLDIASAIMYGRHLEYRISQSLGNLTHSHDPTRATGNESAAGTTLNATRNLELYESCMPIYGHATKKVKPEVRHVFSPAAMLNGPT